MKGSERSSGGEFFLGKKSDLIQYFLKEMTELPMHTCLYLPL